MPRDDEHPRGWAPPGASRLPEAQDELAVARQETQLGVDQILTAVESLLAADADNLEAYLGHVRSHAVAILEACGFQDIVGQRLTKVDRILSGLQMRSSDHAPAAPASDARAGDAEEARRACYLNGPGLAGPEVGQAAINAMFD